MSALPTTNTNHGVTECLTSASLGDISWVQKAASQLYRRNMALLDMFTHHVTAHDQFYQVSPHLAYAGTKRPGYKAKRTIGHSLYHARAALPV